MYTNAKIRINREQVLDATLGKRQAHDTSVRLIFPTLKVVHCIAVNNVCQRNSRALYTFVPEKSFGQLLDILSKKIHFLKDI